MWDILSKYFATPTALAGTLGTSPQAVFNAIRKGAVPSSWVRTLIKQGVCQADLDALPISDRLHNKR